MPKNLHTNFTINLLIVFKGCDILNIGCKINTYKGAIIMIKDLYTNSLLDSLVPISRFNRGEASKIFDEVAKNGIKIVLKNNMPACVLLAPERYTELLEAVEDNALVLEAERRIKSHTNVDLIDESNVLCKNGITEAELDDMEDIDLE